ncbi:MAG: hypothetical protein KTR25_05770 [Myxococcales bacterium]|nr:hypothetical protein [Myxococcales bacterium]
MEGSSSADDAALNPGAIRENASSAMALWCAATLIFSRGIVPARGLGADATRGVEPFVPNRWRSAFRPSPRAYRNTLGLAGASLVAAEANGAESVRALIEPWFVRAFVDLAALGGGAVRTSVATLATFVTASAVTFSGAGGAFSTLVWTCRLGAATTGAGSRLGSRLPSIVVTVFFRTTAHFCPLIFFRVVAVFLGATFLPSVIGGVDTTPCAFVLAAADDFLRVAALLRVGEAAVDLAADFFLIEEPSPADMSAL